MVLKCDLYWFAQLKTLFESKVCLISQCPVHSKNKILPRVVRAIWSILHWFLVLGEYVVLVFCRLGLLVFTLHCTTKSKRA